MVARVASDRASPLILPAIFIIESEMRAEASGMMVAVIVLMLVGVVLSAVI